jgi:hypothetical protein
MHGRHEGGDRDQVRYVRGIGQFMLLFSLLGYGMAFQCEAAEWSLAPSMGVKGIYNSNLLLTPQPHNESYGFWITPAAELAGKTERLEVSSRLAGDFVGYFGGEERRLTNIYLPLAVRYRTEKDIFGFTGGFVRDNTLLGELQTTGIVLQFTQRNQWTANPTWTRILTERLSFQSSLQFSHTTYEGGGTFGLVNYQVLGGTAGFLYKVTEKDQVQLSGSYTSFRTIDTGFRAALPGVMATLEHAFTESLSGTVFGGPRFISTATELTGGDFETKETVWVYGARLSKQFERGAVQVSVGRDLLPSGFGLLVRTDRAGMFGSYQVSETITGALDINGYLASSTASGLLSRTIADQRFVSVSPSVSWKFLEWWQVELAYVFALRDVEGVGQATSHAPMITLTYYPPKLSFSY